MIGAFIADAVTAAKVFELTPIWLKFEQKSSFSF